MSSLFQMIYPDASKQTLTCHSCGKKDISWRGWDGLCDRKCYYDLNNVLERYESGADPVPDERIISYFTLYPSPSHSFSYDKIALYIKQHQQSTT